MGTDKFVFDPILGELRLVGCFQWIGVTVVTNLALTASGVGMDLDWFHCGG